MQTLNRQTAPGHTARPERILQFGKGNFLRAFAEWTVQALNEQQAFNSSVAIVEATNRGGGEVINDQDGLYHLTLEGIKDGQPVRETQLIDCVSRCINPYADYAAYAELIDSPDLRFIISNTTEAGIQWVEGETPDMQPQPSFPGKMTALLYQRYRTFSGAADKGLIILCCELIEDNGDKLKSLVRRHAESWSLEPQFLEWLDSACAFCSTLVDRIVPGYPSDKITEIEAELGYRDPLLVVAEQYHNWVIQAPEWAAREFPADKLGFNICYATAEQQKSIRDIKVRILNGAHTGTMPVAYLSGVDTVREAMEHPAVSAFMHGLLKEEIVPNIEGAPDYINQFAQQILERFENPYIRHEWLSISLNSMSKWETRVLPSLLDALKNSGALPKRMVLSLAALIAFYKGQRGDTHYTCNDNADILELYETAWAAYDGSRESLHALVSKVLGYEKNWQRDLNAISGLTDAVTDALDSILKDGMLATLQRTI